jgi:hypothetical protein
VDVSGQPSVTVVSLGLEPQRRENDEKVGLGTSSRTSSVVCYQRGFVKSIVVDHENDRTCTGLYDYSALVNESLENIDHLLGVPVRIDIIR